MSDLNRAQLLGNVGAEPEVRATANGGAVANIRVATTTVWNDKSGQRQEHTEWHRVVFFGRNAEFIRDYVTKGRQVYVEGEIRTETYTNASGQEAFAKKIYGSLIRATGSASTSAKPADRHAPAGATTAAPAGRPTTRAPSRTPPADVNPFEEDSIPF